MPGGPKVKKGMKVAILSRLQRGQWWYGTVLSARSHTNFLVTPENSQIMATVWRNIDTWKEDDRGGSKQEPPCFQGFLKRVLESPKESDAA